MNEFKKYVKKLMLDRNLTQIQLAKNIGISQSYLSLILSKSRNLNEDIALKLAKALKCNEYKLRILANEK